MHAGRSGVSEWGSTNLARPKIWLSRSRSLDLGGEVRRHKDLARRSWVRPSAAANPATFVRAGFFAAV